MTREPQIGDMVTLTCLPDGQAVEVPAETLLITACLKAGVKVPNLCGNRGLCTTCAGRVEVGHENLSSPTAQERTMLGWIGAPSTVRLTCQAVMLGPVTMEPRISPIDRLDYDPGDFPWTNSSDRR